MGHLGSIDPLKSTSSFKFLQGSYDLWPTAHFSTKNANKKIQMAFFCLYLCAGFLSSALTESLKVRLASNKGAFDMSLYIGN